uniref:RIIa domain-containing protein n=1 Tax=Macrostomum lignano TaxID=282301 RepID=A0A1I8IK58_9PLAT
MSAADSTQTMMGPDVLGYAELCRPGAVEYLERHRIPQLFRSLVAVLMVEQPQDHVAFIKQHLARAIEVGVANLNWETFVYPLHPKRSPHRLEFVRDGTAYETQGVELMQQRARQRGSAGGAPATAAESPAPPPLSPAPSLTASSSGGAGDTFRLTQGQWEDAQSGDMASRLQQTLLEQPQAQQLAAVDADADNLPDLFRLPGSDRLQTPETHEYVSGEVDKLLSEAILMSVAAREQDSEGRNSADEALIASLQANLLADVGRSEIGSAEADRAAGRERGDEEEEKDEGLSLFD